MVNVLQNLIEALRRKLIAQDKDILEIIQDDFDLYKIRHRANLGSNSSDGLTHLITVKDYTDEDARKSIEQIIEMAKAGAPDWFSILKSQMTERAFQEVIESIAASKQSPKLQSEKIIKSSEDVAAKFSDSYPKYGISIVPKCSNRALCGIEFYNRFDPNEEPHEIKFGDRNAESLYMYFLLHPRVDKDNKDILEGWYTIHSKVFLQVRVGKVNLRRTQMSLTTKFLLIYGSSPLPMLIVRSVRCLHFAKTMTSLTITL